MAEVFGDTSNQLLRWIDITTLKFAEVAVCDAQIRCQSLDTNPLVGTQTPEDLTELLHKQYVSMG